MANLAARELSSSKAESLLANSAWRQFLGAGTADFSRPGKPGETRDIAAVDLPHNSGPGDRFGERGQKVAEAAVISEVDS